MIGEEHRDSTMHCKRNRQSPGKNEHLQHALCHEAPVLLGDRLRKGAQDAFSVGGLLAQQPRKPPDFLVRQASGQRVREARWGGEQRTLQPLRLELHEVSCLLLSQRDAQDVFPLHLLPPRRRGLPQLERARLPHGREKRLRFIDPLGSAWESTGVEQMLDPAALRAVHVRGVAQAEGARREGGVSQQQVPELVAALDGPGGVVRRDLGQEPSHVCVPDVGRATQERAAFARRAALGLLVQVMRAQHVLGEVLVKVGI
mmetsp:Transcript_63194/g.193306  ORF Transcript_63194/g.193306 Transcript_63194/m.193306 type:complete len:258 (-) Transcript_63194:242-1015(-)